MLINIKKKNYKNGNRIGSKKFKYRGKKRCKKLLFKILTSLDEFIF